MNKKNRKPAIRFKAFNDPWEQRKLSELASMHARIGWQNLRTSEFLTSGNYMLITGTDFVDGAINYSTCHFVEKERYEQDKNIQIQNGSILITKDGTLGKVAYVQGLSMPATLNAGVFNVRIKNNLTVDGKYLFQYIKAPFLMDYVGKKATGGTIKHLNQNILVDFPITMPKIAEQKMIGCFLQAYDNLITLHQHKLDKLQNVKKACLEKMFPQNGESVPRIRFKGFTDTWEQRKFGGLLESVPSKTFIKSPEINGKYEVVQQGNDPIMGYANGYPCEDYQETVIFGDHTLSLYKPHSPFFVATDGVRIVKGKEKSDGFFLFTLLEKYKPQSEGYKRYFSILSDTSCYFAKDLSEQQKIGEYFECINSLITLHQRKLDMLKNLKKACLEKMFV